jgi:NitT/TauT family transport system permease protein
MTFALRVVAGGRGLAPAPRPPRQPRDPRLGRRPFRRLSAADVVVGLSVLVVLYLIVAVGRDTTVAFSPTEATTVDTSPALLPYDAARSLLRMFIALGASYLFTFVYAYVAAHSRGAERLMIPALDILQSVPVLGFLAITVAGFIALFPGSYLGLELAAIFAICTSQVWNLTFSFYDSLITQPSELDEACRLMGLSRWRRFWRLDLPHGAIGLVWNGMMSMGGGWFFLVVSETVSLANRDYALPGIGSYAGAAIAAGDLGRVGLAVATMVVMVLAVNFVFWRPLVAWSEKFKNEQTEPDEAPRSFVLDLLRRSHWPRALGQLRRRLAEPINRWGDHLLGTASRTRGAATTRPRLSLTVWALTCLALGYGTWRLFAYITEVDGWGIFVTPLYEGVFTLVRVAVLMVVASLVWVPIGVWIGSHPRVARSAQPVVQILASFPANFLFPFVTWTLLRTGISLDFGGIVLMALGAQWYILFNAIAGAQAVPVDLSQAMDDLGLRGGLRWRRLTLPAILPYYITGAITASGGAWNASIVAEIVTYGGTTLRATGLGAYIADAAQSGDYHLILAGISVMALYVVAINRLVWRPLQLMVEAHHT